MEQIFSTHVADTWSLAMSEVHNYIHVEGWVVQECEQVPGSFCPGCVIQTVMEGKGSDVGLKPSEWPLSTALSLPTMLTHARRAPASPVHAPSTALPDSSTT